MHLPDPLQGGKHPQITPKKMSVFDGVNKKKCLGDIVAVCQALDINFFIFVLTGLTRKMSGGYCRYIGELYVKH